MRQITNEMSDEYHRIQRRVSEDPGTAGDQGEENWAELLREWLPPTYTVVTKGRIFGHDGQASPQVDVIVLKDIYPQKLVNKKHYLAAGVAAAFECKTTLRTTHISEAIETSAKIKSLYPPRKGDTVQGAACSHNLRFVVAFPFVASRRVYSRGKCQTGIKPK